ncbi:signal transduction histidine kinase [Sphingomonas vulcanisoli]|uniref:histidine kinase n=1 Tax=Sphingomonas vulcanisoli TaxID=1658060 RepID=A0ABX0TS69_9SPHN|nr:CHASE3 domain-containing protein [Sphingomonas vulcanisoli]NIJ08371.1 signal transduction histidine kinase [Sphingomonas vulcanisoli]
MASLAPRRIPLLPLAGLGVTLLAGIGAILISRGVAVSNRWVDHTVRVQVGIIQLLERLTAEDAGMRGYMLRGDPKMREETREAHTGVIEQMRALRADTADNPVRKAQLDRLVPLIEARWRFAEGRIAVREKLKGPPPPVSATRLGAGQTIAEIRDTLKAMFAEEQSLLSERQHRTQLLTTWLSVALAGTVFLVVIVAYLTASDARSRYISLHAAHREARAAIVAARAEMAAREEAESQLRQMQKIESIGQLTGGIAHDFNNMLAVILGSLELAQRRAADPDRLARHLIDAREGAERAATLVTRLLAFSRRQSLAPAIIDPQALIESMLDMLDRTLGDPIAIRTAFEGEPWRIYADPLQLENAVLNLAVNARDAMGGRGTITVSTNNLPFAEATHYGRLEIAAGHYVEIAVGDTGTGMTEEVRERAFDPFFTTKAVGKGTGLGLSQVFGFVKQSGGHVLIDTVLGTGTTVRILLPRFEGELAVDTIETPSPATVAGGASGRVLVVEDDDRVRQFSCDALRELGYEPVATADGAQALAIIAEDAEIAMVFSDVVMPVMSGPELAAEARRLRPDLPILFTTGYAHDGSDPLLETGQTMLAKPFTIDQLAEKLREAAGR